MLGGDASSCWGDGTLTVVRQDLADSIIPAFSEARSIQTVVGGVLEHLDHVIVIDDYSPDLTTTGAREAGAEVIRHKRAPGIVAVGSISLQF